MTSRGAVLLGHGDTVMVFMSEPLMAEEYDELKGALTRQLPGIKFVLVDSVSGVVVKRKDDNAPEV